MEKETEQLDIAIGLAEKRRYAEALQLFLCLIDTNPDDWYLHYWAGQCFRFTNEFSKSIQFLSKAASLNSKEPQIFLALGIAHQLSDSYELAITALEKAIKLNPKMYSAYNSMGLTYRKMTRFQEALDRYTQAMEVLVSNFADEIRRDNPDRCSKDVTSVDGKKILYIQPYLFERLPEKLKSDPRYAIVLNNIGLCQVEMGDINSARESFKESIAFIPDRYNYPHPLKNLEDITEN